MAIAFDNAANGGDNGGSSSNHSFSYTCGGSATLLVLGLAGGVIGTDADDITSVTYNSVAMSLAIKNTNAQTNNRYLYEYYLVNPATGSNTLAITAGSTHYLIAIAASYSGVSASGQPDNTGQNIVPSSPDLSLTTTLTTVADNCWTVLIEGGYGDGNPPIAGTGLTRRTYAATNGDLGLFDSAAAITPAQAYSMTTSRGTVNFSVGIKHVVASFSPTGGGGGGDQPMMRRWGGFQPVQGVGQSSGGGKGWG